MANYADTPRYEIQYPLITAPTDVPGDIETPVTTIDSLLTPTYAGTASGRPTPGTYTAPSATGTTGRRYYSTDTGTISFDTGSAWLAEGPLNTVSGNISALNPGNSASAGGASGFSAAAEHIHQLPNWGQAADYQPPGTAGAAGSTGRIADAGHVHPGLPVGTVIQFPSSTIPLDYLRCDGGVYSTITYAALYAMIGTAWNTFAGQAAPAAGTFRVPKFIDLVMVGAGNAYGLAGLYGASQQTLSISNLPSHTHTVNDPTHYHLINDPSHGHSSPSGYDFIYGSTPNSTIYTNNGSNIDHSPSWNLGAESGTSNAYTGITIQGAATGITNQNTGGGVPFSTVQPSAGIYYLIKAV